MIGYKWVLAYDIIMSALASTAFHFIPHYTEGHPKVPFVNLTSENVLKSVQWPICDGTEDLTSLKSCSGSWPVLEQDYFFTNLTNYLTNCGTGVVTVPDSMNFVNLTQSENGTFCTLLNENLGDFDNYNHSLIATLRSAISWKNLTKKNLTKKNLTKKKFRKFSVIFFFQFFLAVVVSQPIWGHACKIFGGLGPLV
jgi:hypothetical protein